MFDLFGSFFVFDMIGNVSQCSVHEKETFQKKKQDSCEEKPSEKCVSPCKRDTSRGHQCAAADGNFDASARSIVP